MKVKSTYKCPFCGKGRMQTQQIDYEIQDAVGEKLVIPKVEADICDHCGQRIFGYEAARKLEQHKKRHHRVILRLKPKLRSHIAKLANEHNRTLDEEINRLLEERLKQASQLPA